MRKTTKRRVYASILAEKHLDLNTMETLTSHSICRSTSVALALLLSVVPIASAAPMLAQNTQIQGQTQTGGQQKPQQQAPPEAGGPQGDVGPIAIPKKTQEEAPPPPPRPKAQDGMPDYSLTVDVPIVSLDVIVSSKDGHFVPGLKKEYFRVTEDGVPQTLNNFNQTEAPITAVLLIEFSNSNYRFMEDALNSAYTFAEGLKKEDWVAVIEFDMKPYILVDFTQDKGKVLGALNMLRIPGFSESNTFDALYDTLDRLEGIPGRKQVVLVGSGRDTFSRLTYDKILKKVKDTQGVTIFTVSTGRAFREAVDARYGSDPRVHEALIDYLQADNQMNTFAKMTGGRWYNPRLTGELRGIFSEIAGTMRNQYTLSYRSTNKNQDGTYRKLKVQLVAPGTDTPLIVKNQKGKEIKYQIIAREGYTAKHQVE